MRTDSLTVETIVLWYHWVKWGREKAIVYVAEGDEDRFEGKTALLWMVGQLVELLSLALIR